jgi:hypothetical protein
MRSIYRDYLDQFNPATFHNTMFFEATNLIQELYDVFADLRVALTAAVPGPTAYDVPGPIEVLVYEGFPRATPNRWGLPTLMLADVREFFRWLASYGRALLDRFEALKVRAHQGFGGLPDEGDAAFAKSFKEFVEESPIRTFREALGDETYNRLINQRLSGLCNRQ